MTRDAAVERALEYFDDGRYMDDLARRVAIPTESQKPERLPDLYRYLMVERQTGFEAVGYSCRIYDNPLKGQGPVLLTTRHEGDGLPTV